jgi:hypothetical protein
VTKRLPAHHDVFVLALNPLLVILEETLAGVTLGPIFSKFNCVAYADDVTVIVMSRTDINQLQETLPLYEGATGSRSNYRKSRALPIGACGHDPPNPLREESLNIGDTLYEHTSKTIERIWTHFANSIKGRSQELYARDLNLIQCVHVTHTYLQSKVWHFVQTLPISREDALQITTSVLWFIWY